MLKPYPTQKNTVANLALKQTLLASLIALNVAPALSMPILDSSVWRDIPYHTRSYSDGTWGEQTSFFDADVLIPMVGNNDWMGFVNGSGKYGDDHAWYGSLGSGIRAVKNNWLWGGYVFIDRNTSILDNQFWVLNPGLEAMTTSMDTHVNAYIPTSSKRQSTGIFEGTFLGLNTAHIENRTYFDNIYNIMEVTGPGVDAEVGYRFHNALNIRTFAGAYHFNMQDSAHNITGVEGGFEIPINANLGIVVHDAYDSVQHNTIMGTIRLTLGGVPKTNTINDRMLDPIPRHLGAYQTGGGIPVVKVQKSIGRRALVNNIWFFRPGGDAFDLANGFSNCTPTNPCGILSQDAIDGINALAPNANLFFAPGTYNNPLPATGFNLNAGQSLYGRGTFYVRPASSSNRPILDDTVILPGNNSINDLYIEGHTVDGGIQSGVRILSTVTQPISINNSIISSRLSNSLATTTAYGLYNLSGNAVVNINNSSVLVNMTDVSNTSQINGIKNTNGTINMVNSTVEVNASNTGVFPVKGFENSHGILNMNNSVISVNVNNAGNFIDAIDNLGTVNIKHSTINITANAGAYTAMYGIDNAANSTLNIDGVNINVVATNFLNPLLISGLNGNNSTAIMNYKNSIITVNANSPATAAATTTFGTYNNLGNMICNIIQDGVLSQITCP